MTMLRLTLASMTLCALKLTPALAQEAPPEGEAAVEAIPYADDAAPAEPAKAPKKKRRKKRKPMGRFELAFGGGWRQEGGQAGSGGSRTTADGSPVGTRLDLPDGSASGAAGFHLSMRSNLADWGTPELDLMAVDVGAAFGAAPVINIGALAPELYFRAGKARIGVGVAPELQIAVVSLGEVGNRGACPSRQAFEDGQCESRTARDAYYGSAAGPYTSGSTIDALSLAFAVRPYVRASYDFVDFMGVAVTAGYRFMGLHDDFKVQIDTPEEGNPRDLGSSALGGADLGTIDTAGFGLRLELYFTNGK